MTHSLAPRLSAVEVFATPRKPGAIPAASAQLLNHMQLPEACATRIGPDLGPVAAANGTRAMLLRTADEDWGLPQLDYLCPF